MSTETLELFDTGVLGDAVPVPSAVRVGDLVHLSGSLGNRHGRLELVAGGIAAETR